MAATVTSITRLDPSPTAAQTINFQVVFSGAVENVSADDFQVLFIPEYGPNLVANPSMNSDLSGWIVNNPTAVYWDSVAHTGSGSAKLIDGFLAQGQIDQTATGYPEAPGQNITVIPGKTYYIEAWMLLDAGTTGAFYSYLAHPTGTNPDALNYGSYTRFVNGAGADLYVRDGAFHRYGRTVTMPVNVHHAGFGFYHDLSAAAWVDDVLLAEVTGGNLVEAYVVSVSGTGATYTVTVDRGWGYGQVGLILKGDSDIVDEGTETGTPGHTEGSQFYTITQAERAPVASLDHRVQTLDTWIPFNQIPLSATVDTYTSAGTPAPATVTWEATSAPAGVDLDDVTFANDPYYNVITNPHVTATLPYVEGTYVLRVKVDYKGMVSSDTVTVNMTGFNTGDGDTPEWGPNLIPNGDFEAGHLDDWDVAATWNAGQESILTTTDTIVASGTYAMVPSFPGDIYFDMVPGVKYQAYADVNAPDTHETGGTIYIGASDDSWYQRIWAAWGDMSTGGVWTRKYSPILTPPKMNSWIRAFTNDTGDWGTDHVLVMDNLSVRQFKLASGLPAAITFNSPADGATFPFGSIVSLSASAVDQDEYPSDILARQIGFHWIVRHTALDARGIEATIVAANDADTSVSFTKPGVYEITVEATDGGAGAPATATRSITIQGPTVNTAPTVDVGADISWPSSVIIPDPTFPINATVSDDGLANLYETLSWAVTGGNAANVVISDPAAEDIQVTFTELGTYTLTLTADDGELRTSDSLVVTIVNDTTSPTVESIVRLDPSPTAQMNMRFLVTFSEPVTDVDATDFSIDTDTSFTWSANLLRNGDFEKGTMENWYIFTDGDEMDIGAEISQSDVHSGNYSAHMTRQLIKGPNPWHGEGNVDDLEPTVPGKGYRTSFWIKGSNDGDFYAYFTLDGFSWETNYVRYLPVLAYTWNDWTEFSVDFVATTETFGTALRSYGENSDFFVDDVTLLQQRAALSVTSVVPVGGSPAAQWIVTVTNPDMQTGYADLIVLAEATIYDRGDLRLATGLAGTDPYVMIVPSAAKRWIIFE